MGDLYFDEVSETTDEHGVNPGTQSGQKELLILTQEGGYGKWFFGGCRSNRNDQDIGYDRKEQTANPGMINSR
jgi:hypothetical protein